MATTTNKVVTIIIVGAGQRGNAYSSYSLDFPEKLKVIGVAEPRKHYRESLKQQYSIPNENVFSSWEELAEQKRKIADAVVISTPDKIHKDPAIAFANLKYHILLEKPMATTREDCEAITFSCKQNNVILAVGHVLRYTPTNKKIKELIQTGIIGDLVNIQHLEPIGFFHFAHSYVRGNWRRQNESTFSLMAKCCHDVDLIRYWMGCKCLQISSFGSLNHFKSDKKPNGASSKCIDCSVESTCAYSAKKIYLEPLIKYGHKSWPVSVITEVPDIESVTHALTTGPYGRCVYECDNDVVDNQVVNMNFEGGKTATLSMVAFTELICERQTRIFGTLGEINCSDSIHVSHYDFLTRQRKVYDCHNPNIKSRLIGHGGADFYLMDAFVNAVQQNNQNLVLTGPDDALNSHLLVFAAEESRVKQKIISL